MQRDKQEIESLVSQISFMETQFEKVFSELQDVKSQLQAIQEQRMSRGKMIFSQKRRKYWLLSCSPFSAAKCHGKNPDCQGERGIKSA